ncbi:glycosyltransferase [Kineosporia rhizophila]|uniref:glycosyltransferase family 2 protein n=1 Tax=Kineosporia rhizophila TaxID=84633 RepID=UPI001E58918A|nr:glycosyltransferase [Kineosporia rhizophila]
MSPRGQAAPAGSGADNRRPDLLFVDPELEPPDEEIDWSSWQPPQEPGPSVVVTAVLVAHDGAAFLPRTLDALEAQTRRPDRLIAVDAGSADGSADMLAIATPDLVRLGPQTGFGPAVRAALDSVGSQLRTPVSTAAGSAHRSLGSAVENPAVLAISGALATQGDQPPVEWLWLLHDDGAPAPDALQKLIETVDAGPSIGIAGCKQVSWADSRRLLDVGFTTSRFGARVTGVDLDDIDQGQLDHRSDVLAVATPGMLVRRDLWERLGGPDPALGNARIDLDLCRRAHLAGERVVVVPQAVMAHAEATSSGLRGTSKSVGSARSIAAAGALRDRRAAVHLRLASVALPLLPLLIVWLGAAAVVRALARLALKQPDRALGEIAAYLLALCHPVAWIRARWRARKGRTMSRREYRRLLAGIRPTLRQRRDRLSSYLRAQEEAWAEPAPGAGVPVPPSARPAVRKKGREVARPGRKAPDAPRRGWAVRRPRVDELAQTPTTSVGAEGLVIDVRDHTDLAGTSPGEARHPLDDPDRDDAPITPAPVAFPSEDEIRFDDERELPRRPVSFRIGLLVAFLTGAAGLVALRVLLRGSGVPVGDALIPAPAEAGRLWATGLASWRPTGLGVSAAADPFDLVLALISWPFAGSTRAGTEFLLLGALPLAALAAWAAASALTRSRALRAWAALVWAAAPSLILSVTAGRLGAIVAHLLLPLTALALTRAVGLRPLEPLGPSMPGMVRRRRASLAAASGAGLGLTVLIAAAPALTLPALFTVLVLLAVARTGRRLLLWTLVVPAVLLAPWWQAVARDPRLLLAEPGGASTDRPGSPGWAAALWPADPAVINRGPVHDLARIVAELTGIGGSGLWLRALAVFVVVPPILLGLTALTGRLRRRIAVLAWLVGLAALVTAVAIPVVVTRPGPDGILHGWSGPAVSLLLLTLLTAALSNLDGAAGRLRARSIGFGHWSAVTMGALAVLTPVLVLTSWAADGWTGSPNRWVHRTDPEVLPAVAAAEADGPAATRTLAIQPAANSVRWTLYRTGGPQIGQESAASLTPSALAARAGGDEPVLKAIGALLSGSDEDQRERFADLDVGSVLLLTGRPADPEASEAALAALDVAPGLVRVSNSGGKVLWRVELAPGAAAESGTEDDEAAPTRPARVRLLSSEGELITTVPAPSVNFTAQIPSGEPGRMLVLSEREDSGWQATLGESALEPATHAGWAQAFELPAEGGTLAVQHEPATGSAHNLTRLVVLGLALLIAVPLPRRRLRLLIPQKGWRPQSQQSSVAPPVSTGRRVRRPGDAADRPRRGEKTRTSGQSGGTDPAQAYAEHQARMTDLARRLAVEAADGDDPMAQRPSRRRRRAARQAAEALAAEAAAVQARQAVQARLAAEARPTVQAQEEAPETVVQDEEPVAEEVLESGETGATPVQPDDPDVEPSPEPAHHETQDVEAESSEASVIDPEPTGVEGEPTASGLEDVQKPLETRPGTEATSPALLPPGPRTSHENEPAAEDVTAVAEITADSGDSPLVESAPNPAGSADSAAVAPRSGDAATRPDQGETSDGPVRQQGRERGREAGHDAPADSGEEESS